MSSTRKIIDLRSRPSFLHDFYGATPGTKEYEVAKWLNRRVGSRHDEHFVRSHTLEGFVAEVRESGITSAVVVGRETPAMSISNDRIQEITAPHKELIGIASVDPQTHGVKAAVAEIGARHQTTGLARHQCRAGLRQSAGGGRRCAVPAGVRRLRPTGRAGVHHVRADHAELRAHRPGSRSAASRASSRT